MSTIFEEMDRLAAEKYAEAPAATFDMRPRHQRTEAFSQQPMEESLDEMVDRPHRETFDTDAVRDTTDYRYDLIPTMITLGLLYYHPKAHKFARGLLGYMDGKPSLILEDLADLLGVRVLDLAHLYAQALHEGAIKYGEQNWKRGLSESNLFNHALYHLFKLVSGDNSENHPTLLTWNVMTLTYQRVSNRIKETTNHDSQS